MRTTNHTSASESLSELEHINIHALPGPCHEQNKSDKQSEVTTTFLHDNTNGGAQLQGMCPREASEKGANLGSSTLCCHRHSGKLSGRSGRKGLRATDVFREANDPHNKRSIRCSVHSLCMDSAWKYAHRSKRNRITLISLRHHRPCTLLGRTSQDTLPKRSVRTRGARPTDTSQVAELEHVILAFSFCRSTRHIVFDLDVCVLSKLRK